MKSPIRFIGKKKRSGVAAIPTDLEARVNSSSEKVRQFFFAYLLLITYVLGVVFSTTDKQLLLGNEGLKLPIVDMTVPLIGFYVVVPVFVLALHFNLLQNLESYHFKLMELKRAWRGKVPRANVNATMFDIALLDEVSVLSNWVRAVNSLLCLYSGGIALSIVLWRFSDYQSGAILLWHCVIIFLDLYFVAQTQIAFSRNEASPSTGSAAVQMSFTKMVLRFGIDLIVSPYTSRPRSRWVLLWIPAVVLVALKIWMCYLVFVKEYGSCVRPIGPASQNSVLCDIRNLEWLTPRIKIDYTDVLFTPDTKRLQSHADLVGQKDWRNHFDEASISLDLRDRSLRHLTIEGQVLPKLKASDAQLQGARLIATKLQGADLFATNLQGANLSGANLTGANLVGTNFVDADLSSARLQGANLGSAKLQGVNMSDADLRGANLGGAKLYGANLKSVKLTGANLRYAKFQGAELDHAVLQSTSMRETEFRGATGMESIVNVLSDVPSTPIVNLGRMPKDDDIAQWAGMISSESVRDQFTSRLQRARLANEINLTDFKVDHVEAVRAIIAAFCTADAPALAAVRGVLRFTIDEGHDARALFVSALQSNPNCKSLTTLQ